MDKGASWPRSAWLAIALLMLVHLLPYPAGAVILDTTRDLLAAWQIASGQHYALQGPVINATLHTGPVWFYLLAPVLLATRSVSCALLFIGVLAALKFPLAHALGSRLGGPRLGLLFALALALPGWPVFAQLLASHTSLVETASLAVLYCLLRLARGAGPRWWLGYGVLQSLALHAHPATMVLSLLVAWPLWRRRARIAEDAAWMVAAAVVFAVPFLPMLAFESARGWEGFTRLGAYGEAHSVAVAASGSLRMLQGIVLGGPRAVFDLAGGAPLAVAAAVLQGVLVALAIVGWALALGDAGARRRLLLLAAAAGAVALLLAALRTSTPYYMALVWTPWWAALLACGWARVARGRTVVASLAVACLLLSASASAWLVHESESGRLRLRHAVVGDVRQHGPLQHSSFLPAWRLDRLGARLCAAAPTVLHADVALAYDSALGLPGRMRCGEGHRQQVGIGGGAVLPLERHRLGLAPWKLAELTGEAPGWSAALRLRPTQVVAAAQAGTLPDGHAYPFRPRQRGPVQALQLVVDARPGSLLLVSRLFFAYDALEVRSVRVGGRDVAPRLDSVATLAFPCPQPCPPSASWELALGTAAPHWTDVLVFRPPDVATSTASPP